LKKQVSLLSRSESVDSTSEPTKRIPRRGMKKEESLRVKRMDSSRSVISEITTEEREKPSKTSKKPKDSGKSSKKNKRDLTRSTSESSLSEEALNDNRDSDSDDNYFDLSPIREPRSRLRETSVDRSLISSSSSGISFLGSIDYDSDGSDDTIDTNDDDDILTRSTQSSGSRVTTDESDEEMQEEFFRYMKTQPGRISGVKAFTVYKKQATSHNGRSEASTDYVFAALVASDSS